MIEFKRVDKVYPNGVKALSAVDLTVKQGEFVAIIGLSGSGKSTLIRCVNRMHDISGGELTVNGVAVPKLNGKQVRHLRQSIGMVFQSFNLVTRTTVFRNVLTAFVPKMNWWQRIFGVFTLEQKLKALEALERVDILDKAYARVDQLSGGQQQRVALARALAQNPKIILADEPVASLDPVTSKQVMEDFQRINLEHNISVLINIHDVDLALAYAKRVVGIRHGQIVYDGPASAVTTDVLDNVYDRSSQEESAHVI